MPDTFQDGSDWQQSSEPMTVVQVHEADIWPVHDNSISGTKDEIEDGLHPVIAIGDRADAEGSPRPMNLTGVVVSCLEGLVEAEDLVQVNIADGTIVRQYVFNVLTYFQAVPDIWELAPVVGQPVYVDDSAALSAGVTLSMSPLNSADAPNPLAGYLWYCQDEYADNTVGGPNINPTFDTALADDPGVEQEYCVLLVNAARELTAR